MRDEIKKERRREKEAHLHQRRHRETAALVRVPERPDPLPQGLPDEFVKRLFHLAGIRALHGKKLQPVIFLAIGARDEGLRRPRRGLQCFVQKNNIVKGDDENN